MSFFSNLMSGLRREPEVLPGDSIILDVRSSSEFASGHIEGAINLPLEQFLQGIPKVVPSKSTPVIVYCRSGMRSGQALGILRAQGYDQAFNGGAVGSLALRLQKSIV